MSMEKLPHHKPGLPGLLEYLEWMRKKYVSKARSSGTDWNEQRHWDLQSRFLEWKWAVEELMDEAIRTEGRLREGRDDSEE